MSQFNKILRGVVFAGIFTLPFLPFAVSTSLFFPFITTKGFLFRIIVEIIFFVWLILAVSDKSYRPRFSWILGTFGIFIAVIALADAFGLNPAKSFWSNYERMEGFVLLAHLFAYIVVISSVVKTQKLWNYFWNTTLGASALVSFLGILQLAGTLKINQGDVRVDAYIGNAAYLAVYLLIHIFIAIFMFVGRKKKDYVSWMYIGIAVLNTIILYYSATRGSILGLGVGILVAALLIAIFEKERKILRKVSIGIVMTVLVIGGFFLLIKDTSFVTKSPVLSRFSPQSLISTASTRSSVWNIAFQGFKERPILGWGQENFNYVFNNYYDPVMFNQEPWFDRSHSVFFDWLIAGGILGLLSYMSILVGALWYIWKSTLFSVAEKSILVGLLVAYVFQNLFVFDNLLSYFLFASLLAYIHRSRMFSEVEIDNEATVDFSPYAATFIIIAGIFTVYVVNVPALFANRAMIQGFIDVQEGRIDESVNNFNRGLAYESFGNIEVREQIAQVGLQIASLSNISEEQKQNMIVLGEKALKDQIKETPLDIRHYVLLGSFLNSFSQFDEAINVLTKALELSPQKQLILFEIATSYLNKGEPDKAFEYFEKAYNLAPQFNSVKTVYAIGAVYAGKFDLAQSVTSDIPEGEYVFDNRLVRAYQEKKRYTDIIAIFLQRVALQPENHAHHLSLAAAYIEVNKRTDAIKEIEEAIKLNPEIKELGEYYIGEIKAGRKP